MDPKRGLLLQWKKQNLNIGIYDNETLRRNIFRKWNVFGNNSRKLLGRLYATLSVRSVI